MVLGKKHHHVRGIYLNPTVFADNKRCMEYIRLISSSSRFNAVVIDVKDDNGNIIKFNDINIKKQMACLKKNNIYRIARVVTFKDPRLAQVQPSWAIQRKSGGIWKQKGWIGWVDPFRKEVWRYVINIAKKAARLGFDEIQFDYVRYPENANVVDHQIAFHNPAKLSKVENLTSFFRFVKRALRPFHVRISADVFGFVTSAVNDMGIGQKWEKITQVVDCISPMIYPSYYAKNSYKLKNPENEPYKVLYRGLADAVKRNAIIKRSGKATAAIRPWLQAFSLQKRYGAKEVLDQIRALHAHGINEYLLWNINSKYPKSIY
ncbi:putative glycoside hydrolase [Paenibacillus sp. NPDC058071]|uniref:putative glycoside hydrolase n=1 Tax=Paenibacillus sp. NPDC058071 TaxID=3346326 RepID=UPI0036DADD38